MKAQPSSDTTSSSSSSKAGLNTAAAAAAAGVPAGLVPRKRCLDAVASATEGYSGSDLMELAAQVCVCVRGGQGQTGRTGAHRRTQGHTGGTKMSRGRCLLHDLLSCIATLPFK
jgi:hypothetical protein